MGCSSSTTSDAPADGGVAGVDAPTGPGAGTLPCDVDDVLARNCRKCHQNPPLFAAPMPLMTYADLHAPAVTDPSRPVYQLVEQRIHSTTKPMPQPPNPALGAADLATLDSWIGAGAPSAPEGAPACPTGDAGGTPDAGTGLTCTPDLHIAASAPWSMPQTTDDVYTCYQFDVTEQTKHQAVGFAVHIDNPRIVHHLLLYQADTDPGLGTVPQQCDTNAGGQYRVVYGWAPGGQAIETPPQAGFPLTGTTHYVVQVHYNNINHLAGQTDSSGIDVCTTAQLRPNDADVMAFGTRSFNIPPHASLDITCSLTVPSIFPTVHAFAAFPHMHKLGTLIETNDSPGGTGAPVNLGSQPSWDFQTQLWFPLDATISAGDLVKTRCAWDNTTDTAVTYGPYTSNEMCYSFTMYYPAINSSQWAWYLPAVASSCSTTP